MKLTDAKVRSLPVPETGARITYEGSGFGIRVTAGNARSFVLNYRVDGRERRITIGPYPAWSVDAARKEAGRLRQEADRGADPLAARQRKRIAETVDELADRYLEEHAAHKRSGGEDARRMAKHVVPEWKGRKIESIARRDIAALVDRIARKTPIEANRVLALVRKMFSFALDKHLIESHPCLRMKAPGVERSRTRALQTAAELRALWEITGGGEWADAVPPREAAAIRLLVLTGCRLREVTGMTRAELDLDAAEWTIPADRNKGKRDHLVPLVPEAVALIKAQPDRGPLVFAGARGGVLTGNAVEKALRAACARLAAREAPIEPFTPHDLRRTVETGLAGVGVLAENRNRVLNHKDASVGAKHYNRHDYKAEKRSALGAWAGCLRRLVGGTTPATVTPIRRKRAT